MVHRETHCPISLIAFFGLCGRGTFPGYSAFEARKSDRHGSNDDRRGESAEVLARTVRELDGVRAENMELKKRMESKDPARAPDTSVQSSPLHRRGSSGLEDESKEEVQVYTYCYRRCPARSLPAGRMWSVRISGVILPWYIVSYQVVFSFFFFGFATSPLFYSLFPPR